ncbi:MAG: sigma-70 family RNA polymerase sigma factor [Nitrospinae bacterium]|nr:sigma-70 family RNA polymerase sigma factor [Nitrospinota bacterium]
MASNEKDDGGPDRFHAVYLEHAELVRGVIYNISGPLDLDDLVQEAFVKIWKGFGGFRNDANIKTWIYRIATNTALDYCRKRTPRLAETELEELPGGGENEEDAVRRDLVHKGMRRLSSEHRAIVTLCVFEELSVKDAADALGLPEGTVKSRLHYAKRELAKFFNNSGVRA